MNIIYTKTPSILDAYLKAHPKSHWLVEILKQQQKVSKVTPLFNKELVLTEGKKAQWFGCYKEK